MSHISGRVAIITGASSGIGRATANAFADAGAKVVLASRRQNLLNELAEDIATRGGEALAVGTDVTQESDAVALFEKAVAHFGRVDILVNVAGAADHTPIDELSLECWEQLLAVNLTGAMLCSREAFRHMKTQGRGRIISIGSVSAYRPRPHNACYAVTKFGLVGLTHSLALDGREFGITASIMHPGVTESSLSGDLAKFQVGPRMMATDEVARVILLHADLPDDMNLFESLALPIGMPFLGRG